MNLKRLYNPVVVRLLRSPLNGLISGSVMLITYTGRRSGERYSITVNYGRDGDDLLVVSPGERVWWRNLRGGATATVLEGEAAEAGLLAVLRRLPGPPPPLEGRVRPGRPPGGP